MHLYHIFLLTEDKKTRHLISELRVYEPLYISEDWDVHLGNLLLQTS
uniref:Uncharacterized protein n=1 Tax=Rhizophora mucronata TaxID=61149 RepID=A0A2P2P9E9_RHIMU